MLTTQLNGNGEQFVIDWENKDVREPGAWGGHGDLPDVHEREGVDFETAVARLIVAGYGNPDTDPTAGAA